VKFNLFKRNKLSPLAERQLKYMADRFDEWHKANCPNLSVKDALKQYQGMTIQELAENVK
jgi:hypothetical protein